MKLNNIDIKSCPFCGSDDLDIIVDPDKEYEKGYKSQVICYGCEATGPSVITPFPLEDTNMDAFIAWNKRLQNLT